MHQYFADMFDGREFGIRIEERSIQALSDGVAAPKMTTSPRAAEAAAAKADKPATPAAAVPSPNAVDAADKTVNATSVVKEAVKDGKIAANEKTAFDKTPAVATAVKDEQTRLKEAVAKVEGAPEQYREPDGKLKLINGKPVQGQMVIDPPTDHEKSVATLTQNKDKQNLEQIDQQIKRLEDSGTTVGLDSLKALRDARATAEGKVATVIENKESLVGTYEAEKATLKTDVPENAKDNYQALREKATPLIDKFNAAGGQFKDGGFPNLFGDQWGEQKVDFDMLAKRFSEAPNELDNFAKVQGQWDNSGGSTKADMEKHVAEVMQRDPELATKIAERYSAAVELQSVMKEYNTARDAADGNGDRIAQIDAEIGILNDSIGTDRAALSAQTIAKLEAANKPTDGVLPTTTSTSSSDEVGNGDGSTTKPEGGGGTVGNADGSTTKPEGGDGTVGNADGSTTHPSTADPDTPVPPAPPKEQPIDYTLPANRDAVLGKAQELNLLPAGNTTFDANGQAVYTVQPNDSYWRIADMSDGKSSQEFDMSHFAATVQSNSAMLGRDPQVGLIHPNEQIVIPGRSLEDLIRLLNLPKVEQILS